MPTEAPAKKKRMLSPELRAMARISAIVEELEPHLWPMVIDYVNSRYDQPERTGIVRSAEHPNGLFQ